MVSNDHVFHMCFDAAVTMTLSATPASIVDDIAHPNRHSAESSRPLQQVTASDSVSFNSAKWSQTQLLRTVFMNLTLLTVLYRRLQYAILGYCFVSLVNDEQLHDGYLVKRPFVLLYLRDKFRDQLHVHIVFHLASRLSPAATRPA